MEYPRSADYEVLGFSLSGPPPVGSVYLPWASGLTVLYGGNGAGKTSLLKGLGSAMSGIKAARSTAIMHVRAHQRFGSTEPRTAREILRDLEDDAQPAAEPSGLIEHLLDAVRSGVSDRVRLMPGYPGDYDFDDNPDLVREYQDRLLGGPADRISALVEPFCSRFDRAREITVEVSRQVCFSLTADGTEDNPAWLVEVAAVLSGDTPATSALAVRLGRGLAGLKEGTIHDFAFWDAYDKQAASQVLAEGAPLPIVRVGRVELGSSTADAPRLITELSDQDLGLATQRAIDQRMGLFNTEGHSGLSLALNKGAPELLSEISTAASGLLRLLFLDAPELTVGIHDPPSEWLSEGLVNWQALDRHADEPIRLTDLSEAQRRWSEVAAQLALVTKLDDGGPIMLILDEPEQALHRFAIDHAVTGLSRLASTGYAAVVVASHSAEFVNATDARLVHVKRTKDGSTGAIAMDATTGDVVFDALRMTGGKADVLQGTRVWLLVEGAHDEAVINALIGPDLARCRTQLITLSGTRNLSGVADSHFLFRFTDAAIVIALDRTNNASLFRLWEEAQRMCESGDYRGARRHVTSIDTDAFSPEEREAHRFLVKAVHAERLERVDLFGFEEPDILYYLPVQQFVEDAADWTQLRNEREWLDSGYRENVKQVIKRRSGRPVDTGWVGQVADEMQTIPSEVTDLLSLCQRASGIS